jgi:hypothetical protein
LPYTDTLGAARKWPEQPVFLGVAVLRRVQKIRIDDDMALEQETPPEPAPAASLRRGSVGDMQDDIERAFSAHPEPTPAELEAMRPLGRPAERRKADRRGMDALREEALQSILSQVEDGNFGGLRQKVGAARGFRPSRLMLLSVAIVAGGFAAFLVLQREQPAPAAAPAPEIVTEIVAAPTKQVLVAREAIRVGERLNASVVHWMDWPETAVAPSSSPARQCPTPTPSLPARSPATSSSPANQFASKSS